MRAWTPITQQRHDSVTPATAQFVDAFVGIPRHGLILMAQALLLPECLSGMRSYFAIGWHRPGIAESQATDKKQVGTTEGRKKMPPGEFLRRG